MGEGENETREMNKQRMKQERMKQRWKEAMVGKKTKLGKKTKQESCGVNEKPWALTLANAKG